MANGIPIILNKMKYVMYLVDEVDEHDEAGLARVLAGDVGGAEVEERGAQLVAHRRDQHPLPRPCTMDREKKLRFSFEQR